MPTQQIQLYLAFTHFSQSHRKKLVNGAACCKQTFHSLSATGLSRTLSLIFSWFLSKFSNLVKKKKFAFPLQKWAVLRDQCTKWVGLCCAPLCWCVLQLGLQSGTSIYKSLFTTPKHGAYLQFGQANKQYVGLFMYNFLLQYWTKQVRDIALLLYIIITVTQPSHQLNSCNIPWVLLVYWILVYCFVLVCIQYFVQRTGNVQVDQPCS